MKREFNDIDDVRDFLAQRAIGGGHGMTLAQIGIAISKGGRGAMSLLRAELAARAARAFAGPEPLSAEAWDAMLAEAAQVTDLRSAILDAQRGNAKNRWRVRALAAEVYARRDLEWIDNLRLAARSDSDIERLLNLVEFARDRGLTPV